MKLLLLFAFTVAARCQEITSIDLDTTLQGGTYTDPEDPMDRKDVNPEEAGKFEGDIILPEDPTNRNAQSERRARRWPNRQVNYRISGFNSRTISTIKSAMQEITSKTSNCITFKQRTSERGYVDIKPLSGCFSAAGYTGNRQDLSIGRGCEVKGIVMHELIHALGFYHEQSRNDRDSYIRINTQNIQQGRTSQFRKMSLNDIQHLTSYDYDSIMHYGKYAFSGNRQPTITQLRSGPPIGQRDHLSTKDVEELRIFYKCTGGGTKPVTSRPVTSKPVTSRPVTRPPTGGSGSECDFNGGFCGWTQDRGDNMDWTLRKGKTPSRGTGPSTDRSGRGNYIYLEATGKQNKVGRLVSPAVPAGRLYCLSLWYHMYGAHMGYLRFLLGANGRYIGSVRNGIIYGNKGNSWRQMKVPIQVNGGGSFNFIMEGKVGKGYQSDIAVDNLSIKTGSC